MAAQQGVFGFGPGKVMIVMKQFAACVSAVVIFLLAKRP
jgi:hypothetical protein